MTNIKFTLLLAVIAITTIVVYSSAVFAENQVATVCDRYGCKTVYIYTQDPLPIVPPVNETYH